MVNFQLSTRPVSEMSVPEQAIEYVIIREHCLSLQNREVFVQAIISSMKKGGDKEFILYVAQKLSIPEELAKRICDLVGFQ